VFFLMMVEEGFWVLDMTWWGGFMVWRRVWMVGIKKGVAFGWGGDVIIVERGHGSLERFEE